MYLSLCFCTCYTHVFNGNLLVKLRTYTWLLLGESGGALLTIICSAGSACVRSCAVEVKQCELVPFSLGAKPPQLPFGHVPCGETKAAPLNFAHLRETEAEILKGM